ncbi:hypothetical protein ACIPW5_16345 [Streptomyces sp. NPDC090077]|uniref:hypothetical protein n=1 Tax=Streptomyces sp. NPDC090077 TaxID=3365938 RepID=UPI0038201156
MDADAEPDLDEIVDALYVAHPAGFTAARDEAAARLRRAGDPAAAKRIAGLRRPTLAAWASNALVRAKPAEAEQFLQLGQTLRAAHRSLDGERLRDLSHQQHVVIGALAREAARLAEEAGTPVSETVVRELEQILHAVLADPDAARDWASGRLVRAPAPVSEFPPAGPDAALPPSGRRPRPESGPEPEPELEPEPEPEAGPVQGPRPAAPESVDPARAARLAAARAAAEDAAWAVSAREEELRLAEEARQHAVARAAEADAAVERLLGEAERARGERDAAYAAVSEAEARHREADRAARAARLAAASAERRLHRL